MKPDGLLLIDKQSGISSHDAVDIFRRSARIKKVGHTGTLDPLATGLLVLCVGRATRLQSYLMNTGKTYEGQIQFGWATDTYDTAGKPLTDAVEKSIADLDLESLAQPFRGEIDQMPPQYSAKKVQGVRAYEAARRGETTELKTRPVTIFEFRVWKETDSVARFVLRCSAGTYVRSIAYELGVATGLGAHLKSLRRTTIGSFSVDDAMTSQSLREAAPDTIFTPPHFLSMDRVELPFESVVVDRGQEEKLMQGNSIVVKPQSGSLKIRDLVALRGIDNELIGISEVSEVIRAGGGPVVLQPRVILRA